MIENKTIARIFDNAMAFILLLIVAGSALVFTPLTKSVFEVNKLLVVRTGLIIVSALWATKFLLFIGQRETVLVDGVNKAVPWYRLFRWSGFELPILFWFLINIISALISRYPEVVIIGAYDRWEGMLTVSNYAIFTWMMIHLIRTRGQFFLMFWGIMISTLISALYGVLQSLGYDFMHWSSDPTQRVFACINNPVHYCAYVAMIVPFGLAAVLYFSRKDKFSFKNFIIQVLILLSTMVIFYNQLLSYSRATWLGFFAAMAVFYWVVLGNVNYKRSLLWQVGDFMISFLALALMMMLYLFRIYLIGWYVAIPLGCMVIAYIVFLWLYFRNLQQVLLRLIIIMACLQMQLVTLGIWEFVFFILGGYGVFLFSKNLVEEKIRRWCLMFFIILGFITVSLVLPSWISLGEGNTMRVTNNFQSKVESIKTQAIQGSARSSMWKSAMIWWLENPFYGTGPDTIKVGYPTYRREDYGRLEGGHNFTPDRTHNEYFNNFATKGGLGFISYYFGIVLLYVIFIIYGFKENRNNPYVFLLVGMLSGSFVYLGQVFFNFGVVATLILFFALMGLAIALRFHAKQIIQNKPEDCSYIKFWHLDINKQWRWLCLIPITWFLLGIFQYEAIKPFWAERHYREGENAAEISGNSPERFRFAEHELTIATELAPLDSNYLVKLGKLYEDWYHSAQQKEEKLYLLNKAQEVYERCLKIEPNNPWYLNRMATMYNERAGQAMYAKDIQKYAFLAQWYILACADADRNNPLFQVNAGFFLHRVGNTPWAMIEYSRALSIDMGMADARFNMADILIRDKKFPEALFQYNSVAARDPSYNNLNLNIGRLFHEQGQIEQAIPYYQRELLINPNNMQACLNLAYIHIDMRQWNKAVTYFQQAVNIDPGNSDNRYNYAIALLNNGRSSDAAMQLQEVLRLNPNNERARQSLQVVRGMGGSRI